MNVVDDPVNEGNANNIGGEEAETAEEDLEHGKYCIYEYFYLYFSDLIINDKL